MNDEQLEQAAEYLRGTCKSTSDAIEALDLDVDEGVLEERLLDVDVELCVHCSWWHEVCELEYSEEHGGGLCDQCREELGVPDN